MGPLGRRNLVGHLTFSEPGLWSQAMFPNLLSLSFTICPLGLKSYLPLPAPQGLEDILSCGCKSLIVPGLSAVLSSLSWLERQERVFQGAWSPSTSHQLGLGWEFQTEFLPQSSKPRVPCPAPRPWSSPSPHALLTWNDGDGGGGADRQGAGSGTWVAYLLPCPGEAWLLNPSKLSSWYFTIS